MSTDKIKQNLRTKTIGQEIIILDRTASTMDIAKKMLKEGVPEGTTIFAEEQIRGRGRSGREWSCKKGKGLLLTTVLRPVIQPEKSYLLMVFTAVAIVKTIRDIFNLPVEIDWPNDIVINKKKLGGIIVETQIHTGKPRDYIVGIGINVNLQKHELPAHIDQPATSLTIEKETFIDRTSFARALLQNLDSWYLIFKDERCEYIVEKWQEFCVNIGKKINVYYKKKNFAGIFLGIANNGDLILLLDNGHKKKFKVEHTVIENQKV
ncbi:biotin--[acetyl-CoA-carboxylase] ligase [Candidatus Scalindua japonica]|uniref:biotin--[acetyl-CoA-carboxylase] ligase n=1 Tax=Candidatus Scalindua japonica TaxID=1284222 RepID=UPI0013A57146|nr:biotin--[acetyl-CoA-carboxylase] ligase [Candidatus Scalindua japonica]